MRKSAAARLALGLAMAGVLAGCVGGGAATAPAVTTAAAAPPTTTTVPARAVTLDDATHCPTTQPVAGPRDVSPRDFFGWSNSHGNGKLWVGGLGDGGVIAAGPDFVAQDGSIGIKFGWWRAVPGKLRITGRRLDAPAPPLRGDVPDGYGERGFQASGVTFPSEGCWEVTGDLGTTKLTFVTFVIRHTG